MMREKDIRNVAIVGVVCGAILVITLIAYSINNSNSNEEIATEEETKISDVQDSENDIESVSTQIGKTVEEIENKTENETTTNQAEEKTENSIKTVESKKETSNVTNTTSKNSSTENAETITAEQNEDISFIAPISGQIIREFATDSLVYSDTLQEWITHNGVDIKADKTTVVTAVADGTVYAIKNDPRYGLTVIINHDNGYQTIYSNLLTAEFVVEGESVTQGQSIGTVGNSATFEILDDYHLHFEMLNNNEYVDPTIYIDFE